MTRGYNILKTTITTALLILTFALFCNGTARAQWALVVNQQNVIITSSSYCNEYEDIKFSPDQAFNQKSDRPWMAAKNFNSKKPEWIKMTFTSPAKIAALRIVPGFGRDKYYEDYTRLKKFQLIVNKGNKVETRTYYRFFDTEPDRDMVILFANQPKVKSITLKILDVYPGHKNKYPLVGNLEPVIVAKDRIICSSWALEEAVLFLKATRNPDSAFEYVPRRGGILLSRSVRNVNPLDDSLNINKNQRYGRQSLRDNWEVWETLCLQLSTDYLFNTYQGVSYIWKDPGSNHLMFDITPSPVADRLNYFTLEMTRQKVTEKVKKDGKESSITVLRAVVKSIKMVSEVYTP